MRALASGLVGALVLASVLSPVGCPGCLFAACGSLHGDEARAEAQQGGDREGERCGDHRFAEPGTADARPAADHRTAAPSPAGGLTAADCCLVDAEPSTATAPPVTPPRTAAPELAQMAPEPGLAVAARTGPAGLLDSLPPPSPPLFRLHRALLI